MQDKAAAAALQVLDEILQAQPATDNALFAECTRELCRLRDGMIKRDERGTPLEHVNAVISVVMGGHFPLEGVPWDELHKARMWLAALP